MRFAGESQSALGPAGLLRGQYARQLFGPELSALNAKMSELRARREGFEGVPSPEQQFMRMFKGAANPFGYFVRGRQLTQDLEQKFGTSNVGEFSNFLLSGFKNGSDIY